MLPESDGFVAVGVEVAGVAGVVEDGTEGVAAGGGEVDDAGFGSGAVEGAVGAAVEFGAGEGGGGDGAVVEVAADVWSEGMPSVRTLLASGPPPRMERETGPPAWPVCTTWVPGDWRRSLRMPIWVARADCGMRVMAAGICWSGVGIPVAVMASCGVTVEYCMTMLRVTTAVRPP